MTIDLAGAIVYFTEHVRGQVWNGFSETQQTGGIATAKRILNRATNEDVDTLTISETDFRYRPDYAVYEQALWSMENGPIANGENSAPAFIASDPEMPDGARDTQKALLCPEAMRWLGVMPGTIHMCRG